MRRRSPLWYLVGFSLDLIAIDLLHTLDLGVIQRFVGEVFWRFIDAGCYLTAGLSALVNAEGRKQLGVQALRGMLYTWYEEARLEAGRPVNELWNLTSGMIGSRKNPNLNAKGMESRHCLGFAVKLCKDFKEEISGGSLLLRAGVELQSFIGIINSNPRRMSSAVQQSLLNAYVRHLTLWSQLARHELIFAMQGL